MSSDAAVGRLPAMHFEVSEKFVLCTAACAARLSRVCSCTIKHPNAVLEAAALCSSRCEPALMSPPAMLTQEFKRHPNGLCHAADTKKAEDSDACYHTLDLPAVMPEARHLPASGPVLLRLWGLATALHVS